MSPNTKIGLFNQESNYLNMFIQLKHHSSSVHFPNKAHMLCINICTYAEHHIHIWP